MFNIRKKTKRTSSKKRTIQRTVSDPPKRKPILDEIPHLKKTYLPEEAQNSHPIMLPKANSMNTIPKISLDGMNETNDHENNFHQENAYLDAAIQLISNNQTNEKGPFPNSPQRRLSPLNQNSSFENLKARRRESAQSPRRENNLGVKHKRQSKESEDVIKALKKLITQDKARPPVRNVMKDQSQSTGTSNPAPHDESTQPVNQNRQTHQNDAYLDATISQVNS